MFIPLLLQWWYGHGWLWLAECTEQRLKGVLEIFSVSILLKTLFAPWKQIQSTITLQNFLQSTLDNIVSRFIGATVRILMLVTALICLILITAGGLVAVALWPMLPLLVIILPIISVAM